VDKRSRKRSSPKLSNRSTLRLGEDGHASVILVGPGYPTSVGPHEELANYFREIVVYLHTDEVYLSNEVTYMCESDEGARIVWEDTNESETWVGLSEHGCRVYRLH
jgi:hypothetical protein